MLRIVRVGVSVLAVSAITLTVVLAPAAVAADGEATVVATWSPPDEQHPTNELSVDISGISFASTCYDPTLECKVWVESSYLDPSGPWDFSNSSKQVWPVEMNGGKAMPSFFTVTNYWPNSATPYTHVQVVVKYGTSVAVSNRVQVKDVLAEEPLLAWAHTWKPATSNGYTQYVMLVSAGQRRSLPGEICWQMTCNYSLWVVSGSGQEVRINAGGQLSGNLNSDLLVGTVGNLANDERVFVRLTATDGRTEDSPRLAPPESPDHVVTRGVDVSALTTSLVASGLAVEEACLPLQAFRTPQDIGTVTAATQGCIDAYATGGWAAVARTIATVRNAAGAAMTLSNLYDLVSDTPDGQGQPQPTLPRPVPAPNPSDPQGQTPNYMGDPYWTLVDRIDTRLREDADPQYAPASDSEWSTAAKQCFAQTTATWNGVTGHPCETEKIFLPGLDVFEAAQHDAEAIASNPAWVKLTRGKASDYSPRWYLADSRCFGSVSDGTACDEYPYGSTLQGGPGASLKTINAAENSLEGTKLNQFYAAIHCNVPQGANFLVIPTVLPDAVESTSVAPPTFWVCS